MTDPKSEKPVSSNVSVPLEGLAAASAMGFLAVEVTTLEELRDAIAKREEKIAVGGPLLVLIAAGLLAATIPDAIKTTIVEVLALIEGASIRDDYEIRLEVSGRTLELKRKLQITPP